MLKYFYDRCPEALDSRTRLPGDGQGTRPSDNSYKKLAIVFKGKEVTIKEG